jgi:hypothetical protein
MLLLAALLLDVTAGPRDGGKPVCHLRASLSIKQRVVRQGDALVLKLRIRNLSTREQEYALVRISDVKMPWYAFVDRASQARVEFRLLQGKAPMIKSEGRRGGIPPQRKIVLIAPGSAFNDEIDCMTDRLVPGLYDVKVVYFSGSKNLLPEAAEDLETNSVRVRIELE